MSALLNMIECGMPFPPTYNRCGLTCGIHIKCGGRSYWGRGRDPPHCGGGRDHRCVEAVVSGRGVVIGLCLMQ